jgi:hypothetical protein
VRIVVKEKTLRRRRLYFEKEKLQISGPYSVPCEY